MTLTAPSRTRPWLTKPAEVAIELWRRLPNNMLENLAEAARTDQPIEFELPGTCKVTFQDLRWASVVAWYPFLELVLQRAAHPSPR